MASRNKAKGRLVVIDGPNVGMAHSLGQWPASSRGILLAIDHYEKLGYSVTAFTPRHYLIAGSRRGADDSELLDKLRKRGNLATVPSQDHDDLYWLAYAWEKDALVVTNDRLKDHAEKYDGGAEKFHSWRENKVISYTFVGDDFLPNPAFDMPPPHEGADEVMVVESSPKQATSRDDDKDSVTSSDVRGRVKGSDASSAQKSSAGAGAGSDRSGAKVSSPRVTIGRENKPTVRSARKAFRESVRELLGGGPMNCGFLARQITAEVAAKTLYQFNNRKELMKVMNVNVKSPFHNQLVFLMKDEIKVDMHDGNPHQVELVGGSGHGGSQSGTKSAIVGEDSPSGASQNKSKQAGKKRAWGERISLPDFKKYLNQNRLDKLAVPAHILPPEVERSMEFFTRLSLPVNSASLGNRYKSAYGLKMNHVFYNLDNLIRFLNFRREFKWTTLERDRTMIVLPTPEAVISPESPHEIGFIGRIFARMKKIFS